MSTITNDRQLLKDAETSALAARETEKGVVFRDASTGAYLLLEEGHGWQSYSHSSSEEEWQSGQITPEVAVAVYTFMLRNWGGIE